MTTLPGPVLLAANFREGTVDAFDGDLKLIRQFADPQTPAGYAPFNVYAIEALVLVTFAKQDAEKKETRPDRGTA